MASSDNSKRVNDDSESAYFEYIFQLESKNQVIRKKKLIIEVDGALIRYKLELFGFRCEISQDSGESFQFTSWQKMRWRKSEKFAELPLLFATTEADFLLKR
jgi:hypothetical protein